MTNPTLKQPQLNIGKLSLVMTENCNLSCAYCYARLSNRWCQNKTMTFNIAEMILKKVIIPAKKCELIQFFGGEPTLNIEKIKYIAERINQLYNQKVISYKPRLGIVTNGYFHQKEKNYEVFKKYNIEVTVSIDGPKEINDQLRNTQKGISSYSKVAETINELQMLGINVIIETVYTAKHIDVGYSIIDSIKFARELGAKKLIFQSAYPPAAEELNPLSDQYFDKFLGYYMQAIDWWFCEFLQEEKLYDIYFKDLLRIMLDDSAESKPSGCPAGISSFSIGPEGSIYPCQLLYGNIKLKFGNISDNNFLFQQYPIPEAHCEFEECKHCFARHWCQPCAALNDFFGDITQPPQKECEIRKAVILRIAQWVSTYLNLPKNNYNTILLNAINSQDSLEPLQLNAV